MNEPYRTRDHDEIAWLLLQSGLKADQVPHEVEQNGDWAEVYFLFPGREAQEELLRAYKSSPEQKFAAARKRVLRFVREETKKH